MSAAADIDWDDLPSGDPDGLRDYQRAAVSAVQEHLSVHRSTLLVMATGLGKTVVFSTIARHWPGRVLVLAHREELVEQAKETLERMTGEFIEVEQGPRRCRAARIVVGSVQTVQQKARLERMGKDRFDLIIFDEAHHATARTYRKPLDFFHGAKVLGVTATPDRGDGTALGKIFQTVAFQKDILSGIDDGYLVRVRGMAVAVSDIDLSNVVKSAGELNQGQLDDEMVKGVEGIVKETVRICPERRGIAFFPGVKSAELAAERFNAVRPGSACLITGETDAAVRKSLVEAFKGGRIQYLCNCQVATEGFDAPTADLIIVGRPTLSRSLYTQMVGRGTRPLPGIVESLSGAAMAAWRRAAIADSPKPDCLVLDFVGNSGKHSLVGPEDVLGGSYSSAEVKRAKERLKKHGGGDVQLALEFSRRELREMAKSMRSVVKSQVTEFDPFKVLSVKMEHLQSYDRHYGFRPATENQRRALAKAGVPEGSMSNLSERGARKLFEALQKRRAGKLATLPQLRTIRKYYPVPDSITFSQASSIMEYLKSSGFGRIRRIVRDDIARMIG